MCSASPGGSCCRGFIHNGVSSSEEVSSSLSAQCCCHRHTQTRGPEQQQPYTIRARTRAHISVSDTAEMTASAAHTKHETFAECVQCQMLCQHNPNPQKAATCPAFLATAGLGDGTSNPRMSPIGLSATACGAFLATAVSVGSRLTVQSVSVSRQEGSESADEFDSSNKGSSFHGCSTHIVTRAAA